MENPVPHNYSYVSVAAGAGSTLLGATGKVGQLLERIIVSVATSATSAVTLQDGNETAIPLVPANTPIGVYTIELRMRARQATTPGWRVTTAAGVSLVAVGFFGKQ